MAQTQGYGAALQPRWRSPTPTVEQGLSTNTDASTITYHADLETKQLSITTLSCTTQLLR
jgi:hypothetical protein